MFISTPPTRFYIATAQSVLHLLFSFILLFLFFPGTASALNFSLRWPQSLLTSLASALDFSSCNRVGVESFTFFSRRRWILRNIFTCTSSAPTRFFTSRQRKVYCIVCFSFILFANFQMETSWVHFKCTNVYLMAPTRSPFFCIATALSVPFFVYSRFFLSAKSSTAPTRSPRDSAQCYFFVLDMISTTTPIVPPRCCSSRTAAKTC